MLAATAGNNVARFSPAPAASVDVFMKWRRENGVFISNVLGEKRLHMQNMSIHEFCGSVQMGDMP